MEGILLMLIQLVIQILLGFIKLALMLATLIGRLLAMMMPSVFRAIVALVTKVVCMLQSRGPPNPRSPRPWSESPRPSSPVSRRSGSKPALTYRRRNTVNSFWRSGDK